MENLTEYYKKFTHRDKLEIICAWELFFGDRHSIGVVPFLDKDKVGQSLLKRLSEGPNFDGVGSVLRKLGTTVRTINKENKVRDYQSGDGKSYSVVVGEVVKIKIERYDKEGVLIYGELTFEN
jgi:hypothetical protein